MTEKTLIKITTVIDDDTGNYSIGETDFSYSPRELKEYVKKYGTKSILSILNFFIYEVQKLKRENQDFPSRA